jgi:hypothetical protein
MNQWQETVLYRFAGGSHLAAPRPIGRRSERLRFDTHALFFGTKLYRPSLMTIPNDRHTWLESEFLSSLPNTDRLGRFERRQNARKPRGQHQLAVVRRGDRKDWSHSPPHRPAGCHGRSKPADLVN